MTLDEIFVKYGTDKGSTEHDYGPIYEEHFWSRRLEPVSVVELGVWKGDSLRAWKEYFPSARIFGIDRDPKPNIPGVKIAQIEQTDEKLIGNFGDLQGPFDIIIDDASHISSKTIRSFQLLWPHLKPGGIYVIEDLQTSYDPAHYGHDEAAVDPSHQPMSARVGAMTAMQWCKHLADEVNHGLYPSDFWGGYNISRVTFGLNICFITKAS